MKSFVRFPQTPHLSWLGSSLPRDDKLLSLQDRDLLLRQELIVEEKVDGANVGLSVCEEGQLVCQNRGEFLRPPFVGQFSKLNFWLANHEASIVARLSPQLIAFGEWCAAQHSIEYDALPDWWLLFDIYDREIDRFWSAERRNQWANEVGVVAIGTLDRGRFGLRELETKVAQYASQYRNGPVEGIVLRADEGGWLKSRAKLVSPSFTQSLGEHWRRRPLIWNHLKHA